MLSAASLVLAVVAAGQSAAPACARTLQSVTPAGVLARARSATGMQSLSAGVLHIRSRMIRELRDLSDRATPPFDASIVEEDIWLDPASGVERFRTPGPAGGFTFSAAQRTAIGSDSVQSAPLPVHAVAQWQRSFDAWAVLADWMERGDARVEGRCSYRGYDRTSLTRIGATGSERLLFSETDGLPVALIRTERHYFLGPETVEYLYFNWEHMGAATLPLSTMRIVNGQRDRLRTLRMGRDGTAIVSSDSAPRFTSLAAIAKMPESPAAPPAPLWPTEPPDTVRVGAHSFLLVGQAFTSAVTLAADTVFILDATQDERRAQQDSAWIGRLFPGKHALAFVVATDIWPHIAGLRYWAANGARIIVHPVSRPVVEMALARHWTGAPDLFERTRASMRVKIDTVRTEQARAGGMLRVFAVDGMAGEGVLAAFSTVDKFLWASDRVQDIQDPSLYVTELWQAVQRARVTPVMTSGPHLRAVPWSQLETLARH